LIIPKGTKQKGKKKQINEGKKKSTIADENCASMLPVFVDVLLKYDLADLVLGSVVKEDSKGAHHGQLAVSPFLGQLLQVECLVVCVPVAFDPFRVHLVRLEIDPP